MENLDFLGFFLSVKKFSAKNICFKNFSVKKFSVKNICFKNFNVKKVC